MVVAVEAEAMKLVNGLLKGKCALGHFYIVLVIKCPTHIL
jgi:hypothetical protein